MTGPVVTGRIVPTVTTEDICVPYWARTAMDYVRSALDGAQCILAARWSYGPVPEIRNPEPWGEIALVVDGAQIASGGMRDRWHACAITPGWHTITIWPGGYHPDEEANLFRLKRRGMFVFDKSDLDAMEAAEKAALPQPTMIEPVTVEIRPHSIVLVEVQPPELGRTPLVSLRILDSGFAHNGRWGRRWVRRLGWDREWCGRPTSNGSAYVRTETSEPDELPAPTFVPTLTFEDISIPQPARDGIDYAKPKLGKPQCLVAVGNDRASLRAALSVKAWCVIMLIVDGEQAGGVMSPPGRLWYATGLTAGRHTLNVGIGDDTPEGCEDMSEPVMLDLAPGTIVVIEAHPRTKREPPVAHVRVVQSGFTHSGGWGRRWAHRLGWARR